MIKICCNENKMRKNLCNKIMNNMIINRIRHGGEKNHSLREIKNLCRKNQRQETAVFNQLFLIRIFVSKVCKPITPTIMN